MELGGLDTGFNNAEAATAATKTHLASSVCVRARWQKLVGHSRSLAFAHMALKSPNHLPSVCGGLACISPNISVCSAGSWAA